MYLVMFGNALKKKKKKDSRICTRKQKHVFSDSSLNFQIWKFLENVARSD